MKIDDVTAKPHRFFMQQAVDVSGQFKQAIRVMQLLRGSCGRIGLNAQG
jgi:hypothetical protein